MTGFIKRQQNPLMLKSELKPYIMNADLHKKLLISLLFVFLITLLFCMRNTGNKEKLHTWEMSEITLLASEEYSNWYTDVTCWVELEGPGFSKRIYGFWDGGHTFKVRVVATKPGKWHWQSSSNQPDDKGLNNKQESLRLLDGRKKRYQRILTFMVL
jgi:hypothetical protein